MSEIVCLAIMGDVVEPLRRVTGLVTMAALIAGCAISQQDARLRMLEKVEEGHLCDPRALTQAVTREHAGIDQEAARQETNHLLHMLGCDLPNAAFIEPQKSPAPSFRPASFAEEMPIERLGKTYRVPVRINQTITLPFILDTGATDLVIPSDVALTLIRADALTRGDFIGKIRYSVADGSEGIGDRVIIREVQVGQHAVRNVTAIINPPASDLLLGQSFLSKFGTVTLDYKRLILVLSP